MPVLVSGLAGTLLISVLDGDELGSTFDAINRPRLLTGKVPKINANDNFVSEVRLAA